MWREKLSRWATNNYGGYQITINGDPDGLTYVEIVLRINNRIVAIRGEYINEDTTLDLLVDGLLANQPR